MPPIKKCQSKGKPGFKWGDSGKCYTGPAAKSKAAKQGQAVSISKAREAGHKIPRKK